MLCTAATTHSASVFLRSVHHAEQMRSDRGPSDGRWREREKTYLKKIRLCDKHPKRLCHWGPNCLFAHSLSELTTPQEGPNASYAWTNCWADGKVHRWYGQDHPKTDQELIANYLRHELHTLHYQDIPNWAFALGICRLNIHTSRWPPAEDWGLQSDIDNLKDSRGGRLPPNVPEKLSFDDMKRLRWAWQEWWPRGDHSWNIFRDTQHDNADYGGEHDYQAYADYGSEHDYQSYTDAGAQHRHERDHWHEAPERLWEGPEEFLESPEERPKEDQLSRTIFSPQDRLPAPSLATGSAAKDALSTTPTQEAHPQAVLEEVPKEDLEEVPKEVPKEVLGDPHSTSAESLNRRPREIFQEVPHTPAPKGQWFPAPLQGTPRTEEPPPGSGRGTGTIPNPQTDAREGLPLSSPPGTCGLSRFPDCCTL
jgi:hypothetical protein